MLTLAIDTCAEFGSVALVDENGTREEVLLHAPDGFSGILFAQIQALLARQAIRLSDIQRFAAASGPGSFTGVRIGLAAMKGLAEVMGKPAIPVSNLQAVATFGTAALRAPVIDARRGEIYAAVVAGAGDLRIPECVAPLQRFLESAGDEEFEWVSSSFDTFRDALAGTRFERYRVTAAPRALAAAIARLAIQAEALDPAVAEANYVRRSDAELLWKH